MPKEITNFHHRQVVVNTYVDEELVNRDGFVFDSVHLENDSLLFIKDAKTLFRIDSLTGMILKKEAIFKNYYSLNGENKKIEIYFP
ncbi:hypothetical protein [Neobacillus niacini]|uniref:hypothetical protein n=1 Tax=Neobacillus niacini TaxID=86668 RepID=UPI0028637B8E|nr:hypothetical protein [Neobacillus niacini]MDR6998295.1 hypothetical protein [Neobacillus niacini]